MALGFEPIYVDISDFVSGIRGLVSGCPDFLINEKLFDALSEFCARTGFMRKGFESSMDAAASSIDASVEYIVNIDISGWFPYHAPVSIIDLWIDGEKKEIRSLDTASGVTHFNDIFKEGSRIYYNFPDQSTIQLFPIDGLSSSAKIFIDATYKPKNDATKFDAVFYNDWRKSIQSGALWWLMSIPGREWSNPSLAQHHYRIFENGIGTALIQKATRINGGTVNSGGTTGFI
jgi:hypothetical protein